MSIEGWLESQWWLESEWWLVIAAAAIAFLLLCLGIYTAKLWRATSRLVADTTDTAKKANRAYVGIDEMFFADSQDDLGVHKISVRNFGQTPAHRVSIWYERASHVPAPDFKPVFDTPGVGELTLQPVQAYTRALARSTQFRIGRPGFFTYGRIVYKDVYERWWITCFCYQYDAEAAFLPYGDYNREEGPFDNAP